MKKIWLNKRKNESCILFFNGWGMDESVVSHLSPGKFDICMYNDYNPISAIDSDVLAYKNHYLVAWSLGVWASSRILSKVEINFKKKIALNGTLNPIHEEFGISPVVFNATLTNWTEETRRKFNKRILGGWQQFQTYNDKLSIRTIENQKAELNYLQNEILTENPTDFKFDCALIGRNDLIFTTGNQFKFWNNKTRIIEVEETHYPFTIFESWNEIIDI